MPPLPRRHFLVTLPAEILQQIFDYCSEFTPDRLTLEPIHSRFRSAQLSILVRRLSVPAVESRRLITLLQRHTLFSQVKILTLTGGGRWTREEKDDIVILLNRLNSLTEFTLNSLDLMQHLLVKRKQLRRFRSRLTSFSAAMSHTQLSQLPNFLPYGLDYLGIQIMEDAKGRGGTNCRASPSGRFPVYHLRLESFDDSEELGSLFVPKNLTMRYEDLYALRGDLSMLDSAFVTSIHLLNPLKNFFSSSSFADLITEEILYFSQLESLTLTNYTIDRPVISCIINDFTTYSTLILITSQPVDMFVLCQTLKFITPACRLRTLTLNGTNVAVPSPEKRITDESILRTFRSEESGSEGSPSSGSPSPDIESESEIEENDQENDDANDDANDEARREIERYEEEAGW